MIHCPLPRLLAPVVAAAALLALSGCVRVPELDETVHDHLRDAPYPALMNMDSFSATTVTPGTQAQQISGSLSGRRDRLKSRARQLQATTLVDAGTRARMQAGAGR